MASLTLIWQAEKLRADEAGAKRQAIERAREAAEAEAAEEKAKVHPHPRQPHPPSFHIRVGLAHMSSTAIPYSGWPGHMGLTLPPPPFPNMAGAAGGGGGEGARGAARHQRQGVGRSRRHAGESSSIPNMATLALIWQPLARGP